MPCNLMNHQHLCLLGRDIALHKGKSFALTITLKWMHAYAFVADHDLLTYAYIVHRLAIGTVMSTINNDGNIHLDIFDMNPLATQAYLSWQIGSRIEIWG